MLVFKVLLRILSTQHPVSSQSSQSPQSRGLSFSAHLGIFLLSHPVVCDSLWPHGLQPARLLFPWDSPGKNTEVGYHCLLQGIILTQVLNLSLLPWQVDPFPPGKPHMCFQGSLILLMKNPQRARPSLSFSVWKYFKKSLNESLQGLQSGGRGSKEGLRRSSLGTKPTSRLQMRRWC